MKIITRGVIDWATCQILEEDSHEYGGPIAECKSSGSAPQPVDPYQQALAQYGLSTGTASYNAALNRPNMVNPLGSTTWDVTGYSGAPPTGYSGASPSPGAPGMMYPMGGGAPGPSNSNFTWNAYGLGGNNPATGGAAPGAPGSGPGGGYNPLSGIGGGAPRYTESTQLAPQFNSVLQQPIDTSGLAGMPGGPSTTQDLSNTRNALFGTEMGYLAPEEQLQSETLGSQLANEGATPGSAAYKTAEDQLGRQQTFENEQAVNQAITGGGAEQSRLFGLGSQGLQNQITVRNAPINEFEALQGSPGATSTAMTPDISGAFGQQYQGALAGYNANVASQNANTGAGAALLSSYLMYLALA